MDIFQVFVVIIGVVSVINLFVLLLLVFKLLPEMASAKFAIMTQVSNANLLTAGKLNKIEVLLVKLSNSFNEFVNMTGSVVDKMDDMFKFPPAMQMFRTMDGKFTARSLDELVDKIKKANKESDYLSEEELKKLKEMFEQSDDSDDDGDDDDEE